MLLVKYFSNDLNAIYLNMWGPDRPNLLCLTLKFFEFSVIDFCKHRTKFDTEPFSTPANHESRCKILITLKFKFLDSAQHCSVTYFPNFRRSQTRDPKELTLELIDCLEVFVEILTST
jgi:hypothetical protein